MPKGILERLSMVGPVSAEGRCSFKVIVDTVNLGSRLEGKKAPAEAYVVVELPPDGS
jgi:class 3 adenylate cyclase